jgi:PleD family two-component response regulator
MGLAQYDFRSSLDKLMDEADHKLYMGKANGRNQVVI